MKTRNCNNCYFLKHWHRYILAIVLVLLFIIGLGCSFYAACILLFANDSQAITLLLKGITGSLVCGILLRHPYFDSLDYHFCHVDNLEEGVIATSRGGNMTYYQIGRKLK